MPPSIAPLIAALDTDDLHEQRRASQAILDAGPAAAPGLIHALRTGPPRVRKAAAYLLSRCDRSTDAFAALAAALADPEPKVRQNAAVSLGRLGATAAEEALADALQTESVAWVRVSILLALGALGGAAACAALEQASASTDAEREALRKARDRCLARRPAAEWRRDRPWRQELALDVPAGLESIAAAEAAERGLPPLTPGGIGDLQCPPGLAPWEGLLELRCAYGLRLPAGEDRITGVGGRPPAAWAPDLARLIARSRPLREWREWVRTEEDVLRYRLALPSLRLRRDDLRRVLTAAREACAPLGLVDSPSNYSVELTVALDPDGIRLSVKPCFVIDPRFAYRQKDVGASIHPVVAACLARLVRTPGARTVFDPTCGSGTLLIERALLDPHVRLVGLDVSPTAAAAARANVRAAGIAKRVRIVRGDAADRSAWPACDEVIANLPFGVRTRRAGTDLDSLYASILTNVATSLRPGGRAVLFTANRKAFEPQLAARSDSLKILDRVRVLSGGLQVTAWVLALNPLNFPCNPTSKPSS
jgi:SAM-dependent methyltransferase